LIPDKILNQKKILNLGEAKLHVPYLTCPSWELMKKSVQSYPSYTEAKRVLI